MGLVYGKVKIEKHTFVALKTRSCLLDINLTFITRPNPILQGLDRSPSSENIFICRFNALSFLSSPSLSFYSALSIYMYVIWFCCFLVCLLFELSFLNISQSTAVLCAHTTINTRDIYTYENYNIISVRSVRLDKKGKEKEISSHLWESIRKITEK